MVPFAIMARNRDVLLAKIFSEKNQFAKRAQCENCLFSYDFCQTTKPAKKPIFVVVQRLSVCIIKKIERSLFESFSKKEQNSFLFFLKRTTNNATMTLSAFAFNLSLDWFDPQFLCHASLPPHFCNTNSQKFELFICKNVVQWRFSWNWLIKSRTEFDDA